MLLVSHDRDFLDRVATSVVTAEGEGRWVEYAGGYTDMLAQRGRTRDAGGAGAAAAGAGEPPVARESRCSAEKNVVQG